MTLYLCALCGAQLTVVTFKATDADPTHWVEPCVHPAWDERRTRLKQLVPDEVRKALAKRRSKS